jgi:hypothetical protein
MPEDEVRSIIEKAVFSANINFPARDNGTRWPEHYREPDECRHSRECGSYSASQRWLRNQKGAVKCPPDLKREAPRGRDRQRQNLNTLRVSSDVATAARRGRLVACVIDCDGNL